MSACAAYGCTNRPQKKIPGITFHKFPKDITLRNKWLLAIRRMNFSPTKYSRLCSEHFSEDQIDRTSLACVRLRDNAVPNIFKGFSKHFVKEQKRFSTTGKKFSSSVKEKYITENAFLSHGSSNDIEEDEYNSSDCSLQAEITPSHSSDNTSENGYSHHPNILRIFPAENVTEPIPLNLISINDLNPDLIDALSSSQVTNKNCDSEIILNESNAYIMNSKLSDHVSLQSKVKRLEKSNLQYRKKIKILQQQNRRQKAKIQYLQRELKILQNIESSSEDMSEDCISENEIYKELLNHQIENDNDD